MTRETYIWKDLEARSRRILLRKASGIEAPDLDDLVQECLIRFLRYTRTHDIESHDGLISVIARRAAIDWVRAARSRSKIVPLGPDGIEPAAVPDDEADAFSRALFATHEYFARHMPRCRELLSLYRKLGDWAVVADRVKKTHAAVRKQWSRCSAALRDAVRGDTTGSLVALRDWAEGA